MMQCEIKFNSKDISDKLVKLKGELNEEELDRWANLESHAICSPLSYSLNYCSRGTFELRGQAHVIQEAYLLKVGELSTSTGNSWHDLVSKLIQEGVDQAKVQDFIGNLRQLAHFLPAESNITAVNFETKPKVLEFAREIDLYTEFVFYYLNRMFNPNAQSDIYLLHADIKQFHHNNESAFSRAGVNLYLGYDLDELIVKKDYFSQAVLQLVYNALHHAFKASDDFHKKRDIEYEPKITISGKDDGSGVYVCSVEDNGNGIPRNILSKIFDKGFTTKPDDGTDHGIGLWGVKQFVEANGGNIVVETKLGEGTKFIIRIPYERKA